MTALYLLIALTLLVINAFFVLAEFAIVRVRSSSIEALVARGDRRARLLRRIQSRLDEYLSVCQVGITFTSIGLGFVAEPAVVVLLEPLFQSLGVPDGGAYGLRWLSSHGVAFGVAYLLVSFLHIVLGELVPKSVAIRLAQPASLWCAWPLRVFHALFFVPLVILNSTANGILRLLGMPAPKHHEEHSEDELRIILAHTHNTGVMSFRRLLFLENIFDLGDLKVKDAMRPRAMVRSLRLDQPWSENRAVIREARYSRYPVVDTQGRPVGVAHIKDLVLAEGDPDLARLTRPALGASEDQPLEQLLAEMQRKRRHLALVNDAAGTWTGIVSMEDILEEVVGTIEDEFGAEESLTLAEAMTPASPVLNLACESHDEALERLVAAFPAEALPVPPAEVLRLVREREAQISTCMGDGVALPHARLTGLKSAMVVFGRSRAGVPRPTGPGTAAPSSPVDEKVHLYFLLLTPAGQPRVHQRLLARIARLLDSDFLRLRLSEAERPEEILDAVRIGEQAALD